MKAVILAGGLGKRLRKAVRDKPKSMAPVLGKPFLQYQIEQLKKYSIIEIVLCVGYLANQIKSYFKDGTKFGVNIRYAVEEKPLGTAGALKNSLDYLEDEVFLTLNGDSYSEVDFFRLVKMDEHNRITSFFEKPGKTTSGSIINAGIYLLEPQVLNYIPPGRQISLEKEIFPHLLEKKMPLFGYLTSDYFIDIGTPPKYAQIQEDMKEMIR
jgi:NDP-sugar pyrophosphorylase family protein